MRNYGQTGGRTDITKLTVAFRNSANASKIYDLIAFFVC
jgi:hypothetical protein